MKTAILFKMPYHNRAFRKGQSVWIQYLSGAQAAKVTGRYKGQGRYQSHWVKWEKYADEIRFIPVDVPDDFAEKRKLQIFELSGGS